MVDFKKKLRAKAPAKIISPCDLYDSLDRASDKGPLRPSQLHVLSEWHDNHRSSRDLLIKLHTGQGKTLIGLLMLQSYINDNSGPSVYLCPNNQLVEQTTSQAQQFGIHVCTTGPREPLPVEFLDSKSIYVTTAQKLFNGRTKFKIGPQGLHIGAIVLDDCHQIADTILQQTGITISNEHPLYAQLLEMFRPSLEAQGSGTLASIEKGKYDAALRVPYWDVIDKRSSIISAISKYEDDNDIAFSWPLIRDCIEQCNFYIGGNGLEVRPLACPIDEFSSFHNADHRVFMSATLADDSVLIRSLGVSPNAVVNPIGYGKEKWSGEKMVIVPDLIHHDLNSDTVAAALGKKNASRNHGVVALTGSFASAEKWKANGARVCTTSDIRGVIDDLRGGKYSETIVFANRYDGIDLADSSCRILILDGLPVGDSPAGIYEAATFTGDQDIIRKVMRRIEQGMGRSVRGERDYSVIILTGSDLVTAIRLLANQSHLSDQTREQINIGLEIAADASKEVSEADGPLATLYELAAQCINRDDGWKVYYTDRMNAADIHQRQPSPTEKYVSLRQVDVKIRMKDYRGAFAELQKFLDQNTADLNAIEKSYHLESLAHIRYYFDPPGSSDIHKSAYGLNRYLLLPRDGVESRKITVSGTRASRIAEIALQFVDGASLIAHVDSVVRQLSFGVSWNEFEENLRRAGELLGFISFRPEKEDRKGPDNAWVSSTHAIAFECKSEVELKRADIHKKEIGQLLDAYNWCQLTFPGKIQSACVIIPPKYCDDSAHPGSCRCMGQKGLRGLRESIKGIYIGIAAKMESGVISEEHVGAILSTSKVDETYITNFLTENIGYRK